MTRKLFYENSYLRTFQATVLSVNMQNEVYTITMDQTAFFPEGGGQSSDIGRIGDANVLFVEEKEGQIYHTIDRPVQEGALLSCEVDWNARFRKMQNHTGEHIVCGIVHRLFGYHNVGFHLNEENVTFDFDGELSDAQLQTVEEMANRAVFENVPVYADFFSSIQEIPYDYRSKSELGTDIRIVTVEGYDACACCAPHVHRTGEIGLIKIWDKMRYKGGVRLQMHCGWDALRDYGMLHQATRRITELLSAPREGTALALEEYMAQREEDKAQISQLRSALLQEKLSGLQSLTGHRVEFYESDPLFDVRQYLNQAKSKTSGICAIFFKHGMQYRYIFASESIDLKLFLRNFHQAFSGKGGGSPCMVQGCAEGLPKDISDFFEKYLPEKSISL